MRVVIVTGDLPHHKHFCVRLTERYNVVGILHPIVRRAVGKLGRLRNWATNYGWPLTFLSAAASAPDLISGWTMKAELAEAEQKHYGSFIDKYRKLDRGLVHRAVDVRSTAARELIQRLDPDVVVVLGGPVWPRESIEICRLILNFHGGVSPIYNGSSTINFAFANGHPHLCGGTLMKMSEVIDGGPILAHYLPAVEADDNPVSLFIKTVGGAVTLYEHFLKGYSAGSPLRCIPQTSPPLFYYRYADWRLCQSLLVKHHLKKGLAKKYSHPERIVEYWNTATDKDARNLYHRTIDELLWVRSEAGGATSLSAGAGS